MTPPINIRWAVAICLWLVMTVGVAMVAFG
jgi:hypothetical protein